MKFTYRPLPSLVHLLPSEIEGFGVFAKEYIPENTLIGISHVEDDSGLFENNLIRTPLGGFLNHSDDNANCVLVTKDREWYLWSGQTEIYINYELTIDYNLYGCYG